VGFVVNILFFDFLQYRFIVFSNDYVDISKVVHRSKEMGLARPSGEVGATLSTQTIYL